MLSSNYFNVHDYYVVTFDKKFLKAIIKFYENFGLCNIIIWDSGDQNQPRFYGKKRLLRNKWGYFKFAEENKFIEIFFLVLERTRKK